VKTIDMVANPTEIEGIAEHQEVADKEAAVETTLILKDQSGDQQRTVGYHNPWKMRTKELLQVGHSGRDDDTTKIQQQHKGPKPEIVVTSRKHRTCY
jgi:hypothetical protein